MQLRRAQAVLDGLRSFALDDAQRLAAAKERLTRAEEEVTAARAAFDSASMRAEVSQRVVHGAEELLPGAAAGAANPPGGPEAPEGKPMTLAQELISFVGRQRRPVRRAELIEYLNSARPDIRLSGIGPELTELVRKGRLVRVASGVYAAPESGEGGDA
ncbi:type IV toxin-antitoxin system AbiEi family antitoxin domain-containing protein [Streptomyces sp. NPDC051554]|uniref:type IV toxin-antitoxin system AbiEi family antitoxin domain-containing protein n=1 Tax=Streptomyces sp. NPDC051554 TaxID=3365656 RepID=UPI0037B08696